MCCLAERTVQPCWLVVPIWPIDVLDRWYRSARLFPLPGAAWNDDAMPSLKTKITTRRLVDTRAFYESLFGLTVVEEWDEPGDKGVILQFPGGHREALLEIYDGESTDDFVGLSLQFRVDDLETFIASLPAGVSFEGPNRRPWGSTYLYLRDPNQIQVIVYEGGW